MTWDCLQTWIYLTKIFPACRPCFCPLSTFPMQASQPPEPPSMELPVLRRPHTIGCISLVSQISDRTGQDRTGQDRTVTDRQTDRQIYYPPFSYIFYFFDFLIFNGSRLKPQRESAHGTPKREKQTIHHTSTDASNSYFPLDAPTELSTFLIPFTLNALLLSSCCGALPPSANPRPDVGRSPSLIPASF